MPVGSKKQHSRGKKRKKLFAVILALGLIVAVSGTASAVDVKFGGLYYVVGVYNDSPSLNEDTPYSRAYFYQRIRLEPVFKIAEGLSFTARMDAMEGNWQTPRTNLNGNLANFDWERGYVTFKTGLGQIEVGYQPAGRWGTIFGDTDSTNPRIKFATTYGPLTLIAIYEKLVEDNNNVLTPTTMRADADGDVYYLAPIYNFKGGAAGVLYGYINGASTRPALGYRSSKQILYPYIQATFGSVYVEAELNFIFGKSKEFDGAGASQDYDGLGAYLMAKTNFGPATVGAQIGWSRGNDITTTDDESGPGKGNDWDPALILLCEDLFTWSGGDTNTKRGKDSNFLLLNVFANYKVAPKFSMGAAITYAKLFHF